MKSDLKLFCKINKGLCDLEFICWCFFSNLPLPQTSVTRGHNKKLIKPICNNNWQLNFFPSRIVNIWNSLPQELVNAKSIDIFATKLKSTTYQCSARAVGPMCFFWNLLRQFYFNFRQLMYTTSFACQCLAFIILFILSVIWNENRVLK